MNDLDTYTKNVQLEIIKKKCGRKCKSDEHKKEREREYNKMYYKLHPRSTVNDNVLCTDCGIYTNKSNFSKHKATNKHNLNVRTNALNEKQKVLDALKDLLKN